jgi:predicted PurR-regulated permease PerM
MQQVNPPAYPSRQDDTKPHQIARLALGFALLALGMWTISNFLPAIAWAGVFAIGTWPLYQRARIWVRPGRHNILLPLVFTVLVALLFLGPLAMAGVQIAKEAHTVADLAHQARSSGLPVPDWVGQLPLVGPQAAAWWSDNLSDPGAVSELIGRVDGSGMLGVGRTIGAQVTRRATVFVFTLMTLFFLYKEGDALTAQLLRASERAFGASGERVGRQIVASIHGTIDGLVLLGLAEGVIMGVVYAFAGMSHPTLLGALTAVAAMIPFAATVVFAIVGGILAVQGSVVAGIVVFVFGFVMITVADHAIRPILIGGATKLPFLWVLFGILGGMETWGLLGLFIGPALMAALILLWREWVGRPAEQPAS